MFLERAHDEMPTRKVQLSFLSHKLIYSVQGVLPLREHLNVAFYLLSGIIALHESSEWAGS